MTVRELIDELQQLVNEDLGDAQVWATYNYGDYHSTEALVLPQTVTVAAVTQSAYSESGWAVVEAEAERYEDEPEPTHYAVILGKHSCHRYVEPDTIDPDLIQEAVR